MRALLAALLLAGCAVKGYDLGWRHEGPLTALLGAPLDALSGCRWSAGEPGGSAECGAFVADVDRLLATLPPGPDALERIGARCGAEACTYANIYDRRDVGLATVIPVYKRVALREVRMRIGLDGAVPKVQALTVRDNAPPGYGPVRIGGSP